MNRIDAPFPPRPLVSVILPVYNRRHLIMRAIQSVEGQTFSDWELLIVDDGSTDGLESLILPLVLEHDKYRYLKHSNRKLSTTRNIGIHAALGEYVTFIDSDDEYKPDHLQQRLDYFAAHPHVDVVHGGLELVGPPESHWVRDVYNPDKLIHINDCVVGGTIFAKKMVLIDSGGFKLLSYSAESELISRLEKKYRVAKVDFPTYRYYTGLEDSICTSQKKGMDELKS